MNDIENSRKHENANLTGFSDNPGQVALLGEMDAAINEWQQQLEEQKWAKVS